MHHVCLCKPFWPLSGCLLCHYSPARAMAHPFDDAENDMEFDQLEDAEQNQGKCWIWRRIYLLNNWGGGPPEYMFRSHRLLRKQQRNCRISQWRSSCQWKLPHRAHSRLLAKRKRRIRQNIAPIGVRALLHSSLCVPAHSSFGQAKTLRVPASSEA